MTSGGGGASASETVHDETRNEPSNENSKSQNDENGDK